MLNFPHKKHPEPLPPRSKQRTHCSWKVPLSTPYGHVCFCKDSRESLLQRLPRDFDKWPPLYSVLLHLHHQQLEPPHKWLLISLLLSGLSPQWEWFRSRALNITSTQASLHISVRASWSICCVTSFSMVKTQPQNLSLNYELSCNRVNLLHAVIYN